MSSSYWKNLLNQPTEDSEFLNDFQQLSSKIDDYYKSCPIENPTQPPIQVLRTPQKTLTTIVRGKSASRTYTRKQSLQQTKPVLPSAKQPSNPYHNRTYSMKENSNVSRNSFPSYMNTTSKSSKPKLFDIV